MSSSCGDACTSKANPHTRNPKPETQNLKPETRNPKPETETRTPKPEKGEAALPFQGSRTPSDAPQSNAFRYSQAIQDTVLCYFEVEICHPILIIDADAYTPDITTRPRTLHLKRVDRNVACVANCQLCCNESTLLQSFKFCWEARAVQSAVVHAVPHTRRENPRNSRLLHRLKAFDSQFPHRALNFARISNKHIFSSAT